MAIDFSKFASWDMPVYMNRQNPIPLDKSSVFNTLAEAESYASTSKIAYDGQFLAVTEDGVVKTYVIENKALKEIGSSKAAADSLADAVDKMSQDNVGDIIYVTEDTYVYKDEDGKKVYADSVDDIPSDKKFDEDSAAEYNAAHTTEEGFEPVAAGDIKPDAGVDVYGPGVYIVSGDREVEKLAQSNPGSADINSEVAALKIKVDSKLDASVLDSEAFKFGFSPDDTNTLVLNIGDKTADIDLSKFAIDGMLQSVVLVKEGVEGVSEKAPYFEFTWNCDIDADYEGEQNVMRIELGDILDSAIADKADSDYVRDISDKLSGAENRIKAIEEWIGDPKYTVQDHDVLLEKMSSVLYGDDDDDTNNGLVGNVSDLQNVVGDSKSGLVKDVADLKSAVTSVFRFAGKFDEVPSLDEIDAEELKSRVGSVIVVGDDEWVLAAPFKDEVDYHWVNLGHDSLTNEQIDFIWDDVMSRFIQIRCEGNVYKMECNAGDTWADILTPVSDIPDNDPNPTAVSMVSFFGDSEDGIMFRSDSEHSLFYRIIDGEIYVTPNDKLKVDGGTIYSTVVIPS